MLETPTKGPTAWLGCNLNLNDTIDIEALMKERRIKTIRLANGLELNLLDASRKMIGDRWLIRLIARIEIPDREIERFASTHNIDSGILVQLLGQPVAFVQERTRHFVDDGERENALQEMIGSIETSYKTYMSHPDFAHKFLAKQYRQTRQRSHWNTDAQG